MTKAEQNWIYMSMATAALVILAFLYLISDWSPLNHDSNNGEQLLQELQSLSVDTDASTSATAAATFVPPTE